MEYQPWTSPEPEPGSLHEDIYVLGGEVQGWSSNHREVGRDVEGQAAG
ncbi:MAG: hypothetical protein ACKOTA_00675 [Solirubrobacterales bacterium]